MILKQKVSLAFVEEPATIKTSLGASVINGLTENAEKFPALPVSLLNLTLINNKLTAAVLAAATGEHVAAADLKTTEKTWDANFRATANYVSIIANGDTAIIRMSGFIPTKPETTPIQRPDALQALQVNVNGTAGSVAASCAPADGARAYVFTALPEEASVSFNGDTMIITVGETKVYVQVNKKRKAKFNNLVSGKKMKVSVYAMNSAGIGALANGQNVIPQ